MPACNLLLQISQKLLSYQGKRCFPNPQTTKNIQGGLWGRESYWNPESNPLAYCMLGSLSGLHIRLSRSRETNGLATIKIRLSHAMHGLYVDICTQVQFAKAVSVETACRSCTEFYQGIKGEGPFSLPGTCDVVLKGEYSCLWNEICNGNRYRSAANYSILRIFEHLDLIIFLSSVQKKWHRNEMSGCLLMSRTHFWSQNENQS